MLSNFRHTKPRDRVNKAEPWDGTVQHTNGLTEVAISDAQNKRDNTISGTTLDERLDDFRRDSHRPVRIWIVVLQICLNRLVVVCEHVRHRGRAGHKLHDAVLLAVSDPPKHQVSTHR